MNSCNDCLKKDRKRATITIDQAFQERQDIKANSNKSFFMPSIKSTNQIKTEIKNHAAIEIIAEMEEDSLSKSHRIEISKRSKVSDIAHESIDHNFQNYTFSSETNTLVKSEITNVFNQRKADQSVKDFSVNLNFKFCASNPDEIIMHDEFSLLRSMTSKTLYPNRYFILTKRVIRCFKSKNYYVSFGYHMFEIQFSEIRKFEMTTNPFNMKKMAYLELHYNTSDCIVFATENLPVARAWANMINYFRG